MLNNPVIEVAIGLTFCYASVALMSSTIAEAISAFLRLRARTLFKGIKVILNDGQFQGLALAMYNNALVHPYGDGKIGAGTAFAGVSRTPAYIEAKNFATALIETLQQNPASPVPLQAAIDALPDRQLQALLSGMLHRSAGNIEALHADIAAWFDNSMDRVSGTYKRYAQLMTFLTGLAIAACFNIDSVHLCQELWKDPQRAIAMSNIASFDNQHPEKAHTVGDMLTGIQELPVGQPFARDWRGFGSNLLGILITASAAMFGAPFWFDMLQRLAQLRSAGPKPKEAARK